MALYTVQPGSVVNAADPNQFTNILNGTTTGVQVTVGSRIRATSTGASSGSGGYVGQVAGASPASGTFVTGDIVTDGSKGTTWLCTAGGTPGTWVALPTQIGTTTLSSTSASVTFSSIPAFTHLRVHWHVRTNSGNTNDNMLLRFNGDSGANYDFQLIEGSNATATASASTGQTSILIGTAVGGTGTSGFFSNGVVNVVGASQAASGHVATVTGTWYACWSGTAATSQAGTTGGLWVPSGAITSITLLPAAGSFAAGSAFSLYGLM